MNLSWNWVLLAGFYPLFVAWRSSAGSTIRHALGWAVAAWAAWCVGVSPEWRYVALCLTACAGVAVLGARRPGVGAWHFVVLGLLVTLLMPLLMGLGELRLQREQVWFLGGVLLVGVANYLPTRLFVPAALLLACCALELAAVAGWREPSPAETLLLLAVPWSAWLVRPSARLSRADRAWWLFRHRFGFLWAERMRDQFNRATDNANLGVALGLYGLEGPLSDETSERAETLLAALLKRFDTTEFDPQCHPSPLPLQYENRDPRPPEATPMPASDAEPMTPQAMRRDGDHLVIEWPDGVVGRLAWKTLRDACPCAGCKEDKQKPADPFRILKPEELVPLAPVTMPRVGRYAYKIVWSDGHDSGIYTLHLLRELSLASAKTT